MINIGCHLSVTDGYEAMGKTMSRFGGNTFAWFTRNPRGGRTKPVIQEDVDKLRSHLQRENFGPLVAHGSYTMNLCSAKEDTRANGLDMLSQDLARMELLPGNLYNFHPGSHTGQGAETGIRQIAEALGQVMRPEMQTTVLLETMAGKGSEIGGTFEELREIIDRGIQYRTGIYYVDPKQLPEIEAVYREQEEKAGSKLAVELEPLRNPQLRATFHHLPSSACEMRASQTYRAGRIKSSLLD